MIFSWLFLILEGLICCVFQSQIPENSTILYIIVIGLNCFAVLGEVFTAKLDSSYKKMLLGGFVLRIFLLFWDLSCRNIFVLPNSAADTETFARAAKNAFLYGTRSNLTGVYANDYLRFWYQLFGVQRAVAQYTNLLMFLSICMIVLSLTEYLKIREEDRKLILCLLCFLPNFAVLNSILLRETVIMLMITISVYYYIRWLYEAKMSQLLLSAISCCIGAMFHSGAIAILLGGALVYVLYDRQKKQIHVNRKSFFSLLFVVVGFLVLQSAFGDSLFAKFGGVDSVNDVLNTADRYNSGGSSYDAGFRINNSVLSLIVNTPIRMFYFVASPVPWNWRGIGDIIAFLFSAMVYLYIYYYAIKELKAGTNKNRTLILVLLIMSLASALIFAWGVSNAGTALRHREKFIVVYLMLLAVARSGHTEEEKHEKEYVLG